MLADRILFLDGEALVVDKPAGLPCDPPRDGGLSLENHLAALTFGFRRWPVAVHRLDRDTSGCLLLARNPKAAQRFAAAFAERRVAKDYLAVCDGDPGADCGVVDQPLLKTSTAAAGWRMTLASPGTRGAKEAVTHWRRLAAMNGRTLIAFRPATGRTHQLRVHAADALGCPIVGDPVYGAGPRAARRTLLHAAALHLARPGKPPVAAHAPFPVDLAATGFTAPDPEALAALWPAPDHAG